MASAEDHFGEHARAFGEQVRAALELLLEAINKASIDKNQLFEIVGCESDGTYLSMRHTLDALYQAALTITMRLIVLLYMEARHLQPYHGSMDQPYTSLELLYQGLQCSASQTHYGAWTRIKQLFLLCYEASDTHTRDLSVHREQLFQPGDQHSAHVLQRALAIFESWDLHLPDSSIKRLLTTLKTSRPNAPHACIDFKEFETEVIGLTHQDLLDWQLCWNEQYLYLVQKEGARKGLGTFYTPPELVRAITEHTLEPLVYSRDDQGTLIPQTPEELLRIKICDPACGPGFFSAGSSALSHRCLL
ncbi:hypothetical protein [Dictyobacter formicarum]|uniref:site-specific DNA-methyltransferase (adenine-specific) n=1 Tax=Dictyobacter formicarum TaxID=2778368 RepID=A0ABQ3VL30_9CHLR|nr:hypothetical protein [Dictyobacter formicarum]GHO86394.1 hypothetical protein KSZ_44000 [Dictyobacter formicarum]